MVQTSRYSGSRNATSACAKMILQQLETKPPCFLFVDLSGIAHFNKFRIKMLDRSSLIAKISELIFCISSSVSVKNPYLEILFDSRFVNRFRNDYNAALYIPAQNYLSYGLSVCGSDFFLPSRCQTDCGVLRRAVPMPPARSGTLP